MQVCSNIMKQFKVDKFCCVVSTLITLTVEMDPYS